MYYFYFFHLSILWIFGLGEKVVLFLLLREEKRVPKIKRKDKIEVFFFSSDSPLSDDLTLFDVFDLIFCNSTGFYVM